VLQNVDLFIKITVLFLLGLACWSTRLAQPAFQGCFMPLRPHATNPLKAWLTEFFFTRGLFKGPNEKPLYGYQVSEQEYLSLKGALRQNLVLASHPIHGGNWAPPQRAALGWLPLA